MNIILLSGGSGKRLWPLSNDVRSKQFIKLFYCSVQILIFMGSLPFISSIVVKLFGKDLTFSGRTKIWIQMPVLIAQKPIWGWGQLSGSTVGSILGNKFFTSAHNQWLNTLFQGGVILFLLVALIIIWLSNSTRKFEKNIGNMKLLMLLSIMIDMMFEVIMGTTATWGCLLLLNSIHLFLEKQEDLFY